ncbi:ABC transporter ATP-binding protein [uncultured Ruegeria sp.]|uniref:ABC transporter ATP-binding protein n=1 Tax=uncultured Ruegeria sp. TaxID=259304 RepID=UPI00261311EA|nr:ABC transporter ATP-binding protein [uncultured Ruegeria sp.]
MIQASSEKQVAIKVDNARKVYGHPETGFVALKEVNLDIYDNEFFTLLGPSGCGKTTLLRMIAGFESVTKGKIELFGDEISALPPNKRPINTVFQNYALFPHMTILDNVIFGVKMLGETAGTSKTRAKEMLELVQLDQFSHRKPSELSGGQQQRVAMARALAPHPKVLLLDEPLSALDLKLRQAMRVELKRIQRDAGITFVFVTHDQEEALAMSDRIAVFSQGELQQIGNAKDVYDAPENKFVADFIGETNLVDVKVDKLSEGKAHCVLPGGASITCPSAAAAHKGEGHISIRPERLSLGKAGTGRLDGTVIQQIYLGTDTQVELRLDDGEALTARLQNSSPDAIPDIGAVVGLDFEEGAARLLVD